MYGYAICYSIWSGSIYGYAIGYGVVVYMDML